MYLISRSITADKLFSNPKAEIINLVISLPRMYDQSIFYNSIKHSRFKPLTFTTCVSNWLLSRSFELEWIFKQEEKNTWLFTCICCHIKVVN